VQSATLSSKLTDREIAMTSTPRLLLITLVALFVVASSGHPTLRIETQAQGAGQPLWRIQMDTSQAPTTYANLSRVTGTSEEVIIDFGLNDQPTGTTKVPVRVEQRVVMNHYTAKRLLKALEATIERHEEAFGTIDTDVQKRLKNRRQARTNR